MEKSLDITAKSEKIATLIKEKIGNLQPKTAIILGSGLGSIADCITDKVIIPYGCLPDFPTSTVQGHDGRLIAGKLNGVEILCMKGRVHLYEGYHPKVIAMIIRALKKTGIENLIVTNAAGSLVKKIKPGSLMLIDDHINLSGMNPLIGGNDESIGPRFPDMTFAYDRGLKEKMKAVADKLKIKINSGVYVMLAGPNFETPAEVRMLGLLGGSVVGMSVVPEVISAVHAGMKVVGISVITNYGAGMTKNIMSHEETLARGEKAGKELCRIIEAFMPTIQS